MKSVGERIQNLRDYRNMTIRALAAKLGISESQLSRIESGRTATVSSDILTGLAKAFDVSADYILGLSPLKDNSHILSELRLSEAACEKLVRREVRRRYLEPMDRAGELRITCHAFQGVFYRCLCRGCVLSERGFELGHLVSAGPRGRNRESSGGSAEGQ